MKTPGPARAWRRAILAAFIATLALGVMSIPAFATIYKWIDANGNVGFTDDPEKIPPAYRDSATSETTSRLRASSQADCSAAARSLGFSMTFTT